MDSAPLASSGTTGGTLPLVIFSHGLSAMRTVYSGICCDLASHGFLVASIEHGDESAGLCLRRVPSLDNDVLEYQDDWILFRELKEGEKEFPLRQRQVHARERVCVCYMTRKRAVEIVLYSFISVSVLIVKAAVTGSAESPGFAFPAQ